MLFRSTFDVLRTVTLMNDAKFFWTEVRRWRRYFFVWWICWPPMGMAAFVLIKTLLGEEPPFPAAVVLLIAWGVAWGKILGRLTSLRCPSCGKPAIRHAYFFMRHAECQHCGLKYRSARSGIWASEAPSLSLGRPSRPHNWFSSVVVAAGWFRSNTDSRPTTSSKYFT